MNKQKGDMYNFCTHTWNPIRGVCDFGCSYCYMRRFDLPALRLDVKSMKEDLGKDNFIFVGSGTDMWCPGVPDVWIREVMRKCRKFPGNEYLFQTKDPKRMTNWIFGFPRYLGTTIETNRKNDISKAPDVESRAFGMNELKGLGERTMVTIEPIMDFDLTEMVDLVRLCQPSWVNIGADSKGSGLPEPEPEKIEQLIDELGTFTDVKIKKNLSRLRGEVNG